MDTRVSLSTISMELHRYLTYYSILSLSSIKHRSKHREGKEQISDM